MFTDELIIKFKAGNGGDGRSSFAHYPHNPMGGPDGGDGGRGGNIYLVGTTNSDSLSSLNHVKYITAKNGEGGKKNQSHGKNADDLEILVPIGTKVLEMHPETHKEFELFTVDREDRFLLTKGGRGGWGNIHFASPTIQAPKKALPGEAGEEKLIKLSLELIADIGLIGLPNAGKSTLLSVISNAKPKIGDYAFTTLEPNLGIVHGKRKNYIVADLPGLIEGASSGRGLGTKFLKHIEKTKVVVHLIDINSNNLDLDYKIVRKELENFSEKLKKKPELVVFTKIDSRLDYKKIKTNIKPNYYISAATHENVDQLLNVLEKLI